MTTSARTSRHITIRGRINKGLAWGFSNGRRSEEVDDIQDFYDILEQTVQHELRQGHHVILTGYDVLSDPFHVKNATNWVPPADVFIIDAQGVFKTFQMKDNLAPSSKRYAPPLARLPTS